MFVTCIHLVIIYPFKIVQIFISRLIKHQKMKGISIKNSSEPSSSVLMFVNCNSLLNNEMLSLGHWFSISHLQNWEKIQKFSNAFWRKCICMPFLNPCCLWFLQQITHCLVKGPPSNPPCMDPSLCYHYKNPQVFPKLDSLSIISLAANCIPSLVCIILRRTHGSVWRRHLTQEAPIIPGTPCKRWWSLKPGYKSWLTKCTLIIEN